METLQENKFVFGDPRSPNTLATDQYHVQLMRFDLRGNAEEGEVPKDINIVDIEWPEGVAVPSSPLMIDDDDEMFRRLRLRK